MKFNTAVVAVLNFREKPFIPNSVDIESQFISSKIEIGLLTFPDVEISVYRTRIM